MTTSADHAKYIDPCFKILPVFEGKYSVHHHHTTPKGQLNSPSQWFLVFLSKLTVFSVFKMITCSHNSIIQQYKVLSEKPHSSSLPNYHIPCTVPSCKYKYKRMTLHLPFVSLRQQLTQAIHLLPRFWQEGPCLKLYLQGCQCYF